MKMAEDKPLTRIAGVQFGGDEVVKAKDGAGSATLSMAYAGFRFAEKVIKAVKGESGIVEPTFVYLPGVEGGDEIAKETGCEFFSVPVELGVSYMYHVGSNGSWPDISTAGGCQEGTQHCQQCQRLREEAAEGLLRWSRRQH